MHESIILVLPPPTSIAHNSAIILHVCCAPYDPPRPPLLAYAIHYTILTMEYRVKAKQGTNHPDAPMGALAVDVEARPRKGEGLKVPCAPK